MFTQVSNVRVFMCMWECIQLVMSLCSCGNLVALNFSAENLWNIYVCILISFYLNEVNCTNICGSIGMQGWLNLSFCK